MLTKNISEGDVCSIFFGARIGEDLKEKAGENFETLKKLADDGDVFAQYELAQYEDSKKPEYMTLAADQKYFLAAFELWKMYCFGLNPNYEQARKYFEIAAQSEQHINSMIYLSDIYRNGWGGAVDKEKVLHLCKKIYEREPSEDSINTIALFYKYDQNNPIEAVDWWTIGAEKIFPTCLYNLGWVYFNGRGVEKNWAEAVEYFNKAIAAGANSGFSEKHLGYIYCLGLYGSTRDYEQSVTYYDQAVARGTNLSDDDKKLRPFAVYETTQKYFYSGTDKDYVKALEYYEKSFNLGCNEGYAAKKIADIYWEGGNGVTADFSEAKKWMKRATENGNSYAEKWLEKQGITQSFWGSWNE